MLPPGERGPRLWEGEGAARAGPHRRRRAQSWPSYGRLVARGVAIVGLFVQPGRRSALHLGG